MSKARLATNCVTMGDLERPLRINNFVNELHNGFRLLNLKNDNLRKKSVGEKLNRGLYALIIFGCSQIRLAEIRREED